MWWVLSLALLGTATLIESASPVRDKHLSKSNTAGKTSAAARTSKPVAKKTSHAVSARKTRGRGKASARLRTPPPPSYQLHPDPERYQQIQQALADRGYFKGEANGTWGDDSVDALRKFQADQKLPDDGRISALSLTALGLGPRHDGSTASTVPLQPPTPESLPTVVSPPNADPPELPHR
jgi:peptidoglycan hydrolase-like protein with peptidoglycan-binding domain